LFGPAILLLGKNPKEIQSICERDISLPVFIAVVLTMARNGNDLTVHQLMNGFIKMWYIYT
jgi:3'-phosphoadenosine 5'-phosphosulfate sulfotransferase